MRNLLTLLSVLMWITTYANNSYTLKSPDGRISSTISAGKTLTYNVSVNQKEIITNSALSLRLQDGRVLGADVRVKKAICNQVNQKLSSPIYKSAFVTENYNSLILQMRGNWSVEFRAYNDGVAYRFISNIKEPMVISNEQVEYRFADNYEVTTAYVRGKFRNVGTSWDEQFGTSFENTYTDTNIKGMDRNILSFLPVLVRTTDNICVCLTESDLYDYPGLYLVGSKEDSTTLNGMLATYPKTEERGGSFDLMMLVKERHDFIAKIDQPRSFPWRIAIIGDDVSIANSNLSWLLGSPSRIEDTSWIKPGLASWDWWNGINLTGVDFRAGINTETYLYFIDFAASNNIPYIIIDEGWNNSRSGDVMTIIPEMDLKRIINHGSNKGVGVILWVGYYSIYRDMDNIFKYFSQMGIKGFKIDYMNRDDQMITRFVHQAAQTAAKYKLIVDFHGIYKPAGINRTWPNVLTAEGVYGLETMKWYNGRDLVKYDVQIPFIRQVAGPLDYTPGAMINAIPKHVYACRTRPMSLGTRTRQMALYVVFDSYLSMMSDSPTNYIKEQECTDFIAATPTVWDETRFLKGLCGEYVVVARRNKDRWFIAGLTDWTARDIEVDLSSLGNGKGTLTLFTDGINADRNANDYKKSVIPFDWSKPIKLHLAPGGGFVGSITQ